MIRLISQIKKILSDSAIGRSFLIYFGFGLFNSLIPFLLIPILTKHLNPSQYGLIAIFQGVLNILVATIGLGIDGAVGVKYFSLDRARFNTYLFNAIILMLTSFSLVFGLSFVFQAWLTEILGLEISWIRIAIISSIFQLASSLLLSVLQSSGRVISYGIFQAIQIIINMSASILLVTYLETPESGRILGIIISTITCGTLAFIILIRKSTCRVNFSDLRDISSFGVTLLPHLVAGSIYAVLDRFIVNNALGQDSAGKYFLALQFSLPILMIGDAFNKVFAPWVFKHASLLGRPILRISHLMAATFFFTAFVYGLLIYRLFPSIVGVGYDAARDILSTLIFSSACTSAAYAYVNYIYVFRYNWILSIVTPASVVLYLILGQIVVPSIGIEGMAYISLTVKALALAAILSSSIIIFNRNY